MPKVLRSCKPRKYCSTAPRMKLGTETPIMAMNMDAESHALPRLMAATAPSRIPMMTAKMIARMPRSAETRNDSEMMVITSRL